MNFVPTIHQAFRWSLAAVAGLLVGIMSAQAQQHEAVTADTLKISIEEIDTLHTWCSPLWGHHAPKIAVDAAGNDYVLKFSGSYPSAQVCLMERGIDGIWKTRKQFGGAYQPSLILIDDEGSINVIENSQSEPILHLRSSGSGQPSSFEVVSKGNGLGDGRGWYVGAGINRGTIYMSYITLSYDLHLTWKALPDTGWHKPVLVHSGSVDLKKGNHSWTRPKFGFYGDYGYFVVNETSDGSVKNSYNAVYCVRFLLNDPSKFETECIDSVPLGYGAFSSDFAISPIGGIVCVYGKGDSLYYSGEKERVPDKGSYVAIRRSSDSSWKKVRVFDKSGEACIFFGQNGELCNFRLEAETPPRAGEKKIPENPSRLQSGSMNAKWKARVSHDGGTSWNDAVVLAPDTRFVKPSHMQLAEAYNKKDGRVAGVFEDCIENGGQGKLLLYRLYAFTAELNHTVITH